MILVLGRDMAEEYSCLWCVVCFESAYEANAPHLSLPSLLFRVFIHPFGLSDSIWKSELLFDRRLDGPFTQIDWQPSIYSPVCTAPSLVDLLGFEPKSQSGWAVVFWGGGVGWGVGGAKWEASSVRLRVRAC